MDVSGAGLCAVGPGDGDLLEGEAGGDSEGGFGRRLREVSGSLVNFSMLSSAIIESGFDFGPSGESIPFRSAETDGDNVSLGLNAVEEGHGGLVVEPYDEVGAAIEVEVGAGDGCGVT